MEENMNMEEDGGEKLYVSNRGGVIFVGLLFLWAIVVSWAAVAQWYSAAASTEQWQTVVAQLESQLGKDSAARAQKVLAATVENWPDLSPEEAKIIFANWRGEVRGNLLAQHLRDAESDVPEDETVSIENEGQGGRSKPFVDGAPISKWLDTLWE